MSSAPGSSASLDCSAKQSGSSHSESNSDRLWCTGERTRLMPPETPSQRGDGQTHGAERGLSRFEEFSDAVFAIALDHAGVERDNSRQLIPVNRPAPIQSHPRIALSA